VANDHARRRVLRGTRAKEVAERRDQSLWQALHEALILRLAKLADTRHQAAIEPGEVVQAERKAEALGGVATAAQQRRHPEERVVMVVGWHICMCMCMCMHVCVCMLTLGSNFLRGMVCCCREQILDS